MNSKIKIILCRRFYIFIFSFHPGCLTDFKENVDSGFKNIRLKIPIIMSSISRGFSNIISNEDVVAYFGDDPRIY